ncbi:hypothetical protein [Mesobacillus maritimus]|uniref:hypothetical protein n=1 Tax=Mesobacillus maritimus TaxID=1643336 RepID=UPI002559F5B0|nr:hypothetical protein [Mesobacillus maritimus]
MIVVIQSNMSSKTIIEIWGITLEVFKKYNIPISSNALSTMVDQETLPELLRELNRTIRSPKETLED